MGENGFSGEDAWKKAILGEMERPARMDAVPELLEFVAEIERQEGFGAQRIEEIASALKAALENIVDRVYGAQSGNVTITCSHDPWGKLVIGIVDTGIPLNILLADAVLPGDEGPGNELLKATARLIKRMIDNIEYKRVEKQNVLRFYVSGDLRGKA